VAWSGSELRGGPHFYFEADDGHKIGLTVDPRAWCLAVFRLQAIGARLELVALPDALVSTDDLLPPPADT